MGSCAQYTQLKWVRDGRIERGAAVTLHCDDSCNTPMSTVNIKKCRVMLHISVFLRKEAGSCGVISDIFWCYIWLIHQMQKSFRLFILGFFASRSHIINLDLLCVGMNAHVISLYSLCHVTGHFLASSDSVVCTVVWVNSGQFTSLYRSNHIWAQLSVHTYLPNECPPSLEESQSGIHDETKHYISSL